MAPLDYKFAQFNDILYSTYKTQMLMYSLMIEELYNVVEMLLVMTLLCCCKVFVITFK